MSLQFLQTALQNPNVKALMSVISECEGTNNPDGYNYVFGSSPSNKLRFTDFSHHPNMKEPFRGGYSSAAGKWQILYDTWEAIQAKYNLPDFSPANQDIACAELISQRDVLQKTMDGDFDTAISACAHTWASLPNSPYGQPTHTIEQVKQWYAEAGGTINNADNNIA